MYAQARSAGGTGTPVTPLDSLDMHHPGPPLEPEAGSNLLNSKLGYTFRFFYFSYQSTMSQFVHFMIFSQILSCTLM